MWFCKSLWRHCDVLGKKVLHSSLCALSYITQYDLLKIFLRWTLTSGANSEGQTLSQLRYSCTSGLYYCKVWRWSNCEESKSFNLLFGVILSFYWYLPSVYRLHYFQTNSSDYICPPFGRRTKRIKRRKTKHTERNSRMHFITSKLFYINK